MNSNRKSWCGVGPRRRERVVISSPFAESGPCPGYKPGQLLPLPHRSLNDGRNSNE